MLHFSRFPPFFLWGFGKWLLPAIYLLPPGRQSTKSGFAVGGGFAIPHEALFTLKGEVSSKKKKFTRSGLGMLLFGVVPQHRVVGKDIQCRFPLKEVWLVSEMTTPGCTIRVIIVTYFPWNLRELVEVQKKRNWWPNFSWKFRVLSRKSLYSLRSYLEPPFSVDIWCVWSYFSFLLFLKYSVVWYINVGLLIYSCFCQVVRHKIYFIYIPLNVHRF